MQKNFFYSPLNQFRIVVYMVALLSSSSTVVRGAKSPANCLPITTTPVVLVPQVQGGRENLPHFYPGFFNFTLVPCLF